MVVADLRHGRVRAVRSDPIHGLALTLVDNPTVVDCSAIYRSLVEHDHPIAIYEDHPCIAPPWPEAAICYRNEHGNVVVMHTTVNPVQGDEADTGWEPASAVEWERVRWILNAFVWVGGRSTSSGPFPTSGPMHLWRFAIYADGEPADLHWVQLVPDYSMDHWDMANLVLLGALNYMNCRNVALVEPERRRPVRRRLERLGVRVQTINVTPVGRSARGRKDDTLSGSPLTSVRGHFALYGPEYGRGLLFGKLAGRFWIPMHAKGDPAHGKNVNSYKLNP